MKKTHLIIISALLFIASNSFSQVKFGVKAGVNFANMNIVTQNAPNTKMLTSFHIGGILDYSVNDFFAIQPGVLISGKGFKYEESISGFTVKVDSKPIYIDIPVLLLLRKDIGGVKLFGGAGPYLGFGIAGKYSYSGGGISEDGNIKWGSDVDSNYKRGDFGLSFNGGLELSNGFLFSVSYQLGLMNLTPSGSSDNKQTNRVLGVSIGYLFGEN